MPNTELPIDLENQVVLMKKYVNFRQRKKIKKPEIEMYHFLIQSFLLA